MLPMKSRKKALADFRQLSCHESILDKSQGGTKEIYRLVLEGDSQYATPLFFRTSIVPRMMNPVQPRKQYTGAGQNIPIIVTSSGYSTCRLLSRKKSLLCVKPTKKTVPTTFCIIRNQHNIDDAETRAQRTGATVYKFVWTVLCPSRPTI